MASNCRAAFTVTVRKPRLWSNKRESFMSRRQMSFAIEIAKDSRALATLYDSPLKCSEMYACAASMTRR